MMEPVRCQLCGETYLGASTPDRCPFCGAAGWQMVAPAYWVDYGTFDLDRADAERVAQAVELEIGNASFYKACAAAAETVITASIFKRLSKQELEHAELLCDLSGTDQPPLPAVDCPSADSDKFAEAHRREQRAIVFYLASADAAAEPRLEEVMRGLADIESEHLRVSNVYR